MTEETSNTTLLPDEDGNYDSPALQSLFEVWEDYDNESVEKEEVLLVVSRVEEFIRSQIEGMEKDAESSTVDPHDPNRVAILNGFQEHLSGLEKMREAFRRGDFELVDDAFEQLQSATNQMVMGYQGLLDDEALLAPILCIKCSHENQRSESYCGKCGAILPKVEQEQPKRLLAVDESTGSDDGEGETTPNYIEVTDAHEVWKNETASAEKFLQVLLTVRERHVGQHQEISETLSQAQEAAALPELVEHLQNYSETLEQNVRAMDLMIDSLEQGDEEGVETGLTDLAEATIGLIEAEKRGDKIPVPEEPAGEAPSE